MTEADWLACPNVFVLLRFAWGAGGERKRRLFVCSCCRGLWPLLGPEERRAVETAERFADGLADEADLAAARLAVSGRGPAALDPAQAPPSWRASAKRDAGLRRLLEAALASRTGALGHDTVTFAHARAAGVEAARRVWEPAEAAGHEAREGKGRRGAGAARAAARAAWIAAGRTWRAASNAEMERAMQAQAAMIRDLVGPLVFRPVAPNPSWTSWNDGAILKMAQAVYDERAFDRLPLLADALEDAGCTDADMLSHLRGPGPHARGCWALDLILGGR